MTFHQPYFSQEFARLNLRSQLLSNPITTRAMTEGAAIMLDAFRSNPQHFIQLALQHPVNALTSQMPSGQVNAFPGANTYSSQYTPGIASSYLDNFQGMVRNELINQQVQKMKCAEEKIAKELDKIKSDTTGDNLKEIRRNLLDLFADLIIMRFQFTGIPREIQYAHGKTNGKNNLLQLVDAVIEARKNSSSGTNIQKASSDGPDLDKSEEELKKDLIDSTKKSSYEPSKSPAVTTLV